jgi:hypothetical protein
LFRLIGLYGFELFATHCADLGQSFSPPVMKVVLFDLDLHIEERGLRFRKLSAEDCRKPLSSRYAVAEHYTDIFYDASSEREDRHILVRIRLHGSRRSQTTCPRRIRDSRIRSRLFDFQPGILLRPEQMPIPSAGSLRAGTCTVDRGMHRWRLITPARRARPAEHALRTLQNAITAMIASAQCYQPSTGSHGQGPHLRPMAVPTVTASKCSFRASV